MTQTNDVADALHLPNVEAHPAWHGKITGLEAEARLFKRDTPYTYLVRKGEECGHYYVSFLREDGMVHHQPFSVHLTDHGWYCKNFAAHGPFIRETIDDVLHSVMHAKKEAIHPLLP
jgi:SH2 domain-containing protein